MNILPNRPPIKALSIAGAYPLAIALGIKEIELRSWYSSYRGVVLLHASSGGGYESSFSSLGLSRKNCPKFSIIGAARLEACIQYSSEKLWEAHRSRHIWQGDERYQEVLEQYGKCPFGHVFAHPILFEEPIEGVKGAFSYWEPKSEGQRVGFEKAIAQLNQLGYFS